MKKRPIILILFIIVLSACKSLITVHSDQPTQSQLYQKAIEDAMSPAPDEIYKELVAIEAGNENIIWKDFRGEKYLLVVTWKQDVSYYEPYIDSLYYNTAAYPIWVTTAPELLNRMKSEKAKDVDLRLKQLLGLPPNSVYSYFVEMWVKPEGLFRPCPDNEIADKQCDLCFPESVDSLYVSWINNNRISRYYQCELYDKYPWTQLGYTYDWNENNNSHVGLSEFVIGSDKNVIIKAIYSTNEYLKRSE